MIDAFLTRALDLDMHTREEMARKIAVRLAVKMQTPLPEGVNPERFLEAGGLRHAGGGEAVVER